MRVLFPLFLLLCTGATAQSDVPRLTFKLNLSPLLNPTKEALALAADIRLAPRIEAELGAGAFLGSSVYANEKGESYRGLRLRTGLKYVLRPTKSGAIHLGIEGRYHDIRHISIRQVFRQGQQYIEILPVERTVRTYGLAGRIAWPHYFGRDQRFLFETFMGLGFQTHHVSRRLPPDAELIDNRAFFTFELEPGNSSFLDVLFGVNVGVVLW